MKPVKAVAGGLVVVFLALVIAIVAAFFFLDQIAKAGIEKGGSAALGVPTTVASADVGVLSGTFKMTGFEVANPEGFRSPHFLKLGDGSVAVSLASLRKPTVTLPHLSLADIDVRLEKSGGKANYSVILDNVSRNTGGKKDPAAPKPAPAPGAKDGKKFIVEDLSIKNVTVHVDLLGAPGAVADLTKVTVPIEEIKLHNVGKTGTGVAGSGVSMGELASIVVQAVLAAAVENGGGLIPADIMGELQSGLASLGGLTDMGMTVLGDAKGTIEKLGGEVGKAAEEAGKQVEEIGKGIKDLLPKMN